MAVYTPVSDDELQTFLADYDIGEVTSFAGIAEGVENSNFLVRTTRSTYILTLYEKRVKSDDLPFFVGLMEHLADKGLSCPRPVPSRDGATLRTLNGRPAAVVTFLEGMWHRRIQPAYCRSLGAAMAEMHVAGADFPMTRANDLSVAGWRPLLEACGMQSNQIYHGLYNALNQELGFLERVWPTGLPTGTIHADLFPDNVFFLGGEVSGIIDFYFACTDALAYDLAICLNAWCFEPDGSFNVTKARQLVTGYQTVRTLSAAEREAMPILARGSALRFLLTRLYDWLNHPEGAFVKPKDPMEYHQKLRFHQSASGSAAYGL
ncbi:homoserine kinase [Thalassobaculum fulvum]|uniref:Homoserine kinase n=1 Tax=Thalassobaculum fulvum TaxID=1633335 RepID=A0A919CQZ1_9PROT|nr:homoserine kinase [Thalassobaculum fulvum]GHD56528.1 homoserine kinase [Thalassobaculum fulvum]